ncbi:type II toxin-antitoxin system RelE family toxin [Wolbachia endosymbiont of Ctenocephalides felis wCfeJ]|uniref:type II toxin-antitoxin system RelE family toxin n=1 Tax=Wolbachia endosymbiont of Ctenocephalides felis wCfeJ TaxID=2732594 RepID=UPI0014474934|nr:type II toxin-antitoxin system RelE/ParE family toxin [Wolbachia endosymbiont of Ctenocephalides felis wCfeJ]WCR58271.1 MAG: hypothetical protein PG980_000743 [Wolbachia endosymbiont of Ctenocephalides felis wCfeJ]
MGIKYYKIKFLKSVIERDLPALPVTIELRVNKAIQERLRVNPTKLGKPLFGRFRGYFRLRVGDYRIIYQIKARDYIVLITAIRHRKNSIAKNSYYISYSRSTY